MPDSPDIKEGEKKIQGYKHRAKRTRDVVSPAKGE